MKRVTVISSSPRKGGNSEVLARSFAEGARSAGNEVRMIDVNELDLKFCSGCMYCQSHGKCALNDGMNEAYAGIQDSDVLVFATPIYYYSISGQLKTFLDRCNPLYFHKNEFKEVYLLTTAADADEGAADGAVTTVQGWIDCFEGVELKGVIRAVGVTDRGDINNTDFLAAALRMGRKV